MAEEQRIIPYSPFHPHDHRPWRAKFISIAVLLFLLLLISVLVGRLLWQEHAPANSSQQVVSTLGTKQIDELLQAFDLPTPTTIKSVNAILDHGDVEGVLKCSVVFDLSELETWREQTWLNESNTVSADEVVRNSISESNVNWWTAAVRGSDNAYAQHRKRPKDYRFVIVHVIDDKAYVFMYRSALDMDFSASFLAWFRTNPKPNPNAGFMPIPGHAGIYEKKWP